MSRINRRRDHRIFSRRANKTPAKNVFGFHEPRGSNKL